MKSLILTGLLILVPLHMTNDLGTLLILYLLILIRTKFMLVMGPDYIFHILVIQLYLDHL